MMIAFQAPASKFADALYAALEEQLAGEELVRWEVGAAAPAGVTVLLAMGPVTRELLASLPELQLVHVLTDGYETVDVDAATEMGVWVTYSEGDATGNADSVAEFAVLLMLGAVRQIMSSLGSLRDRSIAKPGNAGTLLQKTVCIVGPGSIGEKIATRLLPFGVRLTAVARSPLNAPKGIATRPMEELKDAVAGADFVVLAVRATKQTEHMIDAGVIAAMKKGSVLVNVARGSLVDEKALYEAVKSGHLAGAGMDVLEHEPVREDEPLLELPQMFITPHVAGQTDVMVEGTAEYVSEVIRTMKAGKQMDSLLNRPKSPRLALEEGKS